MDEGGESSARNELTQRDTSPYFSLGTSLTHQAYRGQSRKDAEEDPPANELV